MLRWARMSLYRNSSLALLMLLEAPSLQRKEQRQRKRQLEETWHYLLALALAGMRLLGGSKRELMKVVKERIGEELITLIRKEIRY